MNKRIVKQILLIHPLKFVCEGIKKFAGAQDVSVFYLTAPEPFIYLVKDLKPDVILVHESMVEELHDDIEGSGLLGHLVVVIGEAEGHVCLKEPINLAHLVSEISKILASGVQTH